MKAEKSMRYYTSWKSLITVLVVFGLSLGSTSFAQTSQRKAKKQSAYLFGDSDGMYLQALEFNPFNPTSGRVLSSTSRVEKESVTANLTLPFTSSLGRRPAIRLPWKPPLRSPFQP